MKKAILVRYETGDEGTFGRLISGAFSCHILELPWRDNRQGVSCVPEGEYLVKWTHSTQFNRMTYQLMDVPGREGIRIHEGNWAGDVEKGFKSNVKGCLLPGNDVGRLSPAEGKTPQAAVLSSFRALNNLVTYFNLQDFKLEITSTYQ